MQRFAKSSTIALISLATASWACSAQADDLLGLYAGASVGYSTQYINAVSGGAEQHDTGWKVMAGIRPISFVGAEVEYFNLGTPSRVIDAIDVDAKSRGEAAFGVLYLPYGIGDLFVKAGGASLDTRSYVVSNGGGSTVLYGVDETDTVAAWGGGGQVKFDNLAVRVEYEGFNAPPGRQSLISAGVLWSF